MDSRNALLKGLKQQQQGKYVDAERAYLRVLEHEPRNPDALHLLGTVYLTLGRPDKAASCIRQSITINPRFATAHANLGAALRACGDPGAAVESCERALVLNPSDAGTWSNLANALAQLGHAPQALEAYERAITINPKFVDPYLNRGMLLEDLGKSEAALQSYEQGIAQCGKDTRLLARRAVVLVALRRYDEARSELELLRARPATGPEILNTCALAFDRQGQRDEAARLYGRALKANATSLDALVGLAKLRAQEGRLDEAVSFARRAIAAHPHAAEAHLAVAAVEQARMNQAAALESCERALTISPGFRGAHVLRGTLLAELGRWSDSLAALDLVMRLGTSDPAVYVAHGITAECCNQLTTAAADFARALELEPDLSFAASNLLLVKLRLSDWSTYEEDLRRLRLDVPQYPFAALTTVDDPALHLLVARRFDTFIRASESPRRQVLNTGVVRPIRIGYLSPDFGQHPVTHAVVELLERHDRNAFHITGFSLGIDDGSAARRRIVRAFDNFVDVQGAGDVATAERIREHQIDILIDLAGYTRGGRSEVLKQHPAPIQAAFLGYPATMGYRSVDYLIADRFVIPATAELHYDEKLALLPECFMPYDTTRAVDATALTRAQCNLPETGIVFCCFNTAFKINPPVFDIWMRLLSETPGSVLWLRHGGDDQAANLRREAQRRGVNPERLVFARRVDPDSAYLAQYRLADLFFDTFPYNAHQTSFDALWAGLPVVTCTGASFAARVAGSALHHANLPDLVTGSLAEYEDLARALVADPTRLASLRARVQSARSSPLFDMNRRCRNFEATLRQMWDFHCAGEQPRTFVVERTNETVT